ncbi:MAG TPA: hypothetical protein VF676_03050 [Flavobacterium sp.]|jgi:hypothetical protein
MKFILAICIIWLIGSSEENYRIQGVQINCSTNHYDSQERYIELKQNNALVRKDIKTKHGKFVIDNLAPGHYVLKYKNKFGQICSREIILNKSKTYKVQLCTDQFMDLKESTYFDTIKNDTLFLEFRSSGCFHTLKENIKFFKNNSNLTAQLHDENGEMTEVILNKTSIEAVSLFMRKLYSFQDAMGGCTTAETYILRMKDRDDLLVRDRTCEWKGYDELRMQLFNK